MFRKSAFSNNVCNYYVTYAKSEQSDSHGKLSDFHGEIMKNYCKVLGSAFCFALHQSIDLNVYPPFGVKHLKLKLEERKTRIFPWIYKCLFIVRINMFIRLGLEE